MKPKMLLLLLLSFLTAALAGQQPVKKTYITKPVNPHPPIIDGRLDDPVWEKVEWATGFTQREPDDGAAPTFQTAFKILYDEKNLYIGIRAYDNEPDKIVRRVTRRDGFDGDWLEINIDSYFDHRTGFSFTINAAGVKGDEAISNDGENWDSNWNPVWFAEVGVDNEGWVAEMRIPFSQLRFPEKAEHVWGIQIQRRLFRKEERSTWQHIPRTAPGWVSYFGELHGLQGIHASQRIEILPYSVSSLRRFAEEPGNPFATGQLTKLSGGLDAKVGVTSNLTMDVTVNPDFGQVEADPSEVNLTAFETFFEEKRPFFIEGQNILDYRIMGGDGSFSNDRLFYSRRIGRPPQHSPELNDGEYAKTPESASIAAAVKLTGKTPSGFSIGILDAVTDEEKAEIDFNGQRRQQIAEPRTNYFVGRLQKDYNKGASAIGSIFTATHRDLSESHLNFLNRSAYSGGFDFRHQWKDKTYYLDVRTAFSHIRGEREALWEAQTSSRRYYQRPDANYVEVDSSRTSLSGHGGYLSVGRGGNSRLVFSIGGMWRSPGLELNDLGFLRQADRILQYVWFGYRITNPVSIFRRLNVNVNQWAGWNFGGENVFAGGNINGGGQLKNHWWFWLGFGREGNDLSTTALRGGPAMQFPSAWTNWYNLSTDERKALQFGIGGFNSWPDEGDSRYHNLRFWVTYRPHNAMSIRINPFFDVNKDDLQYVTTTENGTGTRYLFGHLDQKTLGITLRLDYSVTPNLSIQYYGQPFVSAGKYSAFKRITAPRAARYEDRFHTFAGNEIRYGAEDAVFFIDENGDGTTDYSFDQPDFNFRQFRSNLVIRWEYSPGSTLFLVWSQGRTGFDGDGHFSARNDMKELFNVFPDNVFLVKLNRWFSL
ncbi:MAG: carbohydrate binding family 9 domain-containing protein [candidate division KSB1 bacterium]|nr:carbohydrate binding family 9 domain-containing protein [candidate division KSB1 bacterium]MDZ7302171.1 carbohydrate binding family 9 domain-containing protein [candidate division KSB1 bacterium]MDZ7311280.1 carbohydrate binding family 9 domain-containing protein [candidate division KSB1 bacterium]